MFRQALAQDPAFPYRWSDLGEALAASGQSQLARICFRRSVELAPNSPQIAIRAANFYLREGETIPALRLSAIALRTTPAYDTVIFNSWMRLGGDLNSILANGVGSNRRSAEAFFRFLLGSNDGRASKVWAWMEGRSYATRDLATTWADWLIGHQRDPEAFDVWKRHVARDASWGVANRIDNSGFELQSANKGFDWRLLPCPGVTASIDSTTAHSGRASLRLVFDGSENIDFHHAVQHVWMPPGRYRLSAWVRTDNLTTDQGVSIILNGAVSPALNGTHDWTQLKVDMTVPSGAGGEVRIVRQRSLRFDSKPSGTVWIDDVELRRIAG